MRFMLQAVSKKTEQRVNLVMANDKDSINKFVKENIDILQRDFKIDSESFMASVAEVMDIKEFLRIQKKHYKKEIDSVLYDGNTGEPKNKSFIEAFKIK